MGLFTSIAAGIETKADIRYGALELWRDVLGTAPVKSGVPVNWKTSLQVTTVLACVRRIAEALMVPRKVYRRIDDKQRREERDHPLYEVLANEPNELQSGLEYMETLAFHVALTSNHYSYINRVNGKIVELIPFDPGAVTKPPGRSKSERYRVNLFDGTYANFADDEIWHVRGPSWDGVCGLDTVKLIREAIGLALATEETHARLHSNGAQPGGILTTDKELSKDARDRLKEMWSAGQVGLANKFRTAVLDNGLKWQSQMMTGVDAQHIQVRQFQVEEICRGMGVMPIMVGYSGDKAPTYASAEQLFLAHLVHTVRPWHDRVASSADRWLLTKEERARGYYVAFVDAAFLSPAMKDKAEYNKIALGGGGNPAWVTVNEVRGWQELAPIIGGDVLYMPTNTAQLGADGKPLMLPKPDQSVVPKDE